MKIVYLSSSIIPSRSANSIHVMKMSQAFAKNNCEVILLAPNRKAEEEKEVKDIYSFYAVDKVFEIKKLFYPNVKLVRSIVYAVACLLVLFKVKPDLVYGRNLLACYISSFFFITSFEAHSPMDSMLKKLILQKLVKKNNFKNLVVISNALRNLIIKQLPKNTNTNIVVAHDGADEVVELDEKIELQGRNKLLNVGYVGHLYKGRGVGVIFDCAKKLKNFNFHLIGGQDKDIKYWKDLAEAIEINNVYFYGFVTPSTTVLYRNTFDILVAPYANQVSVYGGFGDTSSFMSPLKIFEYMSHKKPIIASDLPVLKEVLSCDNSILCDPEDVDEWINAFKALQDKKIREHIASNAYNDFIKNYTWLNRVNNVL